MDLGKTIAALRKERGIRQKDLAAACGISETYVSLIENGHNVPNMDKLQAISRELGVPVPVIFFLSLSEEDIPDAKKAIFAELVPPLKAMISKAFAEPLEV